MADEPRKRSRFDQTETEPRKGSRFDRRSRSPSNKRSDDVRSRSPGASSMSPGGAEKQASNPAAAAAAAAAKINALIQAKKSAQSVDAPAVISTLVPRRPESPSAPGTALKGDVYQQDGDYIRDIEVNDLRNRYTLTKGATQKMIKDETGADVTTRGAYYPDKSMATAANPPLYLHVTSTTKDGLEKAIAKIDELMQEQLPNLIDERRFKRREPEQVERDELGRRKWPEERVPIDLEPIAGFNLRAQVVGHGGSYVRHIQDETRCRVQIKGRGSGFIERDTGQEVDEPMFLHVAGPDASEVQRAKALCEDLLGNVREQYQQFKDRGPRQQHFGGDRGGGGGGNDYGNNGYGNRDRGGGGSYGSYNSRAAAPSAASPQGAGAIGAGAGAAGGADYAAAYGGTDPYAAYGGYDAYVKMYTQYYGSGDPYAAYGGYEAYVAMYQQQQQQQQQQQPPQPNQQGTPAPSGPSPAPGIPGSAQPAYGVPPPPAPSDSQPPPPPPGASAPGVGGGYNAVPPPPGI